MHTAPGVSFKHNLMSHTHKKYLEEMSDISKILTKMVI